MQVRLALEFEPMTTNQYFLNLGLGSITASCATVPKCDCKGEGKMAGAPF